MVGLSKSSAVDHLLARFRPSPDCTSPSPPAPVAVMVDPVDTSPSQGQEIVRYEPSTQRETRSQIDRLAKADAGNLQARLELITLEAAEEALASRFCTHDPDRSILSYLKAPGNGVASYEAASTVLEELADRTEGTALDSAMVFRYIEAHALWKGHPNADVRSAEDLVRSLDGSDYVQANIIIGTSAQATKRHYIHMINKAWGAGWFDKIPVEMRDPAWLRPEDCSKRMLTQIAANAKQDMDILTAVAGWSWSLQERNDHGARQRLGIKSKATPYLLPTDVASMNRGVGEGRKGKRTSEMFFPDEATEDRLRIDLEPALSTNKLSPSKPDYTGGAAARGYKKRKRPQAEEPTTRTDEPNQGEWQESADGRWLTKRVRNHIIRKPVVEILETESSRDSSPDPTASTTPTLRQSQAVVRDIGKSPQSTPGEREVESSAPRSTKRTRPCRGPGFASGVRKISEMFEDLKSPTYLSSRCCDQCCNTTTAAVKSLRKNLHSVVRMMSVIDNLCLGVKEIPPGQDETRPGLGSQWWPDELLSEGSDIDPRSDELQ